MLQVFGLFGVGVGEGFGVAVVVELGVGVAVGLAVGVGTGVGLGVTAIAGCTSERVNAVAASSAACFATGCLIHLKVVAR